MKQFLLLILCVVGFTSCEVEHHEHKTTPPKDSTPTNTTVPTETTRPNR